MKEEQEINDLSPYVEVACKAFRNNLPGMTGSERILIITDATNDPDQQELAEIAQDAFLKLGHQLNRISIDIDFTPDKVEEILENYELIFNVSQSAHRGTLFNLLGKTGNRDARIISPIGANKEVFAPNGPLDENLEELSERLFRIDYLLKGVVGLRITTPYGTNLKIPLDPARRWAVVLGIIHPGSWDNMTGAEICTTPDEFKTEGTFVLYGIDSENLHQELAVDEPVILKIKNGLIISIQGGLLAERLKSQLKACALKEIQEGRSPLNVYRIAEVGLPSKVGKWPLTETSTVMTEKSMLHIAFGSSQHGEDGADGFFYVNSHWDELVPNATITVYRKPSDFENNHNGKQIMVNGVYTFL